MDGTQRCGGCKEQKPIDQYSASHQGKPGTWCRACVNADARGDRISGQHPPRECIQCGKLYVPKQLKARASYCSRECNEKARTNLPARRDARIRRDYGITLAEYEAMIAAQGGGCAICGVKNAAGRWNRWHIDHCHTSGKVRGMLCVQCNHGLGQFRDNPTWLRRAADYLEGHVASAPELASGNP